MIAAMMEVPELADLLIEYTAIIIKNREDTTDNISCHFLTILQSLKNSSKNFIWISPLGV